MSDQELKPCPFCGEHLEWGTDLCGFVHQGESFCVASGLLIDKIEVDRWNTRTPDPMLEELAGALEKMADIYYGRDNQPIAGAYAREMDAALQKYQQSKVEP